MAYARTELRPWPARGGSMDDLIDMWQAQNAIDLYLLSNLPEGGLEVVAASADDLEYQRLYLFDLSRY
jgi:hypothetical protein